MSDREKLFLSCDQVLDAIDRDFGQYPSQLNLLEILVPMVYGENAYLVRDPKSTRLWLKIPERKKPLPVDEDQVVNRLIQRLKSAPPTDAQLAEICSRVFQAPAKAAGGNAHPTASGVWIEVGMGGFTCRQCGRCCRQLDYRDGCSIEDFRRWQELGRSDILRWVGTTKEDGKVVACRIWMIPGTNRFSDHCPWLKRGDRPDRYVCTIHDQRPTICRQYPGSRKHARMTGCRGIWT